VNSRKIILVYTDYKSPYAYLAKDLVYELERDFPVTVDWLPYTLDIPSSWEVRESTIAATWSNPIGTRINGGG
jgi:hypothetical protein